MIYPPILVTGAPRSGTTFIGRMLSLPPRISYVDEPLNAQTGIQGIDQQFLYMSRKKSSQSGAYAALIQELLSGQSTFKPSNIPADDGLIKRLARRNFSSRKNVIYKIMARNPLKRQYLIKDPMACFASEYLHRNMGMRTVVVMRHPASTIASYKRLDWRFGLGDLTKQADLMQNHLQGVLGGLDIHRLAPIQEWSYLWLSIYTVLGDYLANNPKILVVRHEDLSLDPLQHFGDLYERLGLSFTPRIQRNIIRYTRSGNPIDPPGNAAHVLKRDSAQNMHRWKQILTPEEIAEIKRITGPLAGKYYRENEW